MVISEFCYLDIGEIRIQNKGGLRLNVLAGQETSEINMERPARSFDSADLLTGA
jgi:hypothetical protein